MEAFALLVHGFAVLLTWKTLGIDDGRACARRFRWRIAGTGRPERCCDLAAAHVHDGSDFGHRYAVLHYWGVLFGGAITSILFNIPGEAWSVATTFDGYPMAQQGKAAEALTAAFTSSFIGSLFAVLLITFLAPGIASFALRFGPPEFLSFIAHLLLVRRSGP